MTPGPADEARRALRAARERAARETADGASGGEAREGGDSPAVGEAGAAVPGSAGSLAADGDGDPAVPTAGNFAGTGVPGAESRAVEQSGNPAAQVMGDRGASVEESRAAERHQGPQEGDSAVPGAEVAVDRAAAEGAHHRGSGSAPADGQGAVHDPGPTEPRPGDAARAALREAVAARRAAFADGAVDRSETDAGDAASGHVAAEPDSIVDATGGPGTWATDRSEAGAAPRDTDRFPQAASPTADGREAASTEAPGTRPADAAREALRAARKRRADTEAAEAQADLARRSRRVTPTASRERDRESSRTPGTAAVRARDVRELLADAFRMPEDAPRPGEGHEAEHEDNSSSRQASSLQETQETQETHAPDGIPPDTRAAPRHPHSMAAPTRDNDLRRTFPAFPPHSSEDARFAATWWGNAWVTALEEGALDAKRLARGRGYAEQGHVDAITVTPGLVLAYVQGSRARPYRVQVRLRTLGDADWDRFLDLAADRTGHIAALLDKEMPEALAECGVPLLPGPGDLEPQCSCPDRGHPCKHAAALCYQTARLLDADPFVLLLLRGRGERELLDALSRLSAARAARSAQEREPAPLPGVRAVEALAPRRLPPLPAPLPVPPHPEQPPAYPASPGGPDPFALDQLATDAAARAHALLGTGRDPVGELTLWQDAVRLAAARPGSGLTAGTRALYASLAAATDRTPADLARAVAAWRQGGLEGLAVLEEPWDPPAGRFDRARPLLLAADLPAFRPWRNHLTHPRGHLQLRLGRDGLWYAYESEPGHDDWWPRGTPDLDPVGALTGLGTPTDL
ncbi:SWIM zinc finger family protein [Streptomyces sp. NPDC006335]|uniref:SWIM zinc finger family protein n=1 Tax=Streptomyces sp. NPDC006335 TaxID=3156895 RepID=UPI0033AB3956